MNESHYLEEYIQLRAEIRLYLSKKSHFEIIIALFSIIVGISFTLHEPLPLLFFSIISIFLIEDLTRRKRAIYRISTYIQAIIEPNLSGLKWESYGSHFLNNDNSSKITSSGIDVMVLTFLALAQWSLSLIIWLQNDVGTSFFNKNNIWIFISLVIIFINIHIYSINKFRKVRNDKLMYERKWKEIEETLDNIRN